MELEPISPTHPVPAHQAPPLFDSKALLPLNTRTVAAEGSEAGSVPPRSFTPDGVIVKLVRFDVYVKLTKLQLFSAVPNV
jgi:hypothetical protein